MFPFIPQLRTVLTAGAVVVTSAACSFPVSDAATGGASATGQSSSTSAASASRSSDSSTSAWTPTDDSGNTPDGMPEMPDAARAHTLAGARAFASYYYTIERAAYSKTRPDYIALVSHGSCSACLKAYVQLAQHSDAGESIVGNLAHFTPKTVRWSQDELINSDVVVSGDFERAAGHRRNRSGQVLNAIPSTAPGTLKMGLRWEDGHWLVTDSVLLRTAK